MSNHITAALADADTSTYAATTVEHAFDVIFGSEITRVLQNQSESTPRRLRALPSAGAVSTATREEILAVKAAQMLAEHIAESAYAAMNRLGDEFNADTFIVDAARAAAGLLAPALQPLTAAQRAYVVDRAVDPTTADESLDLILDGVGQMLHTYARFIKTSEWTCLQNLGNEFLDGRVVAWVDDTGWVIVDVLHPTVPDGDDALLEEVRDIFAVMLGLFDSNCCLEFYPTRTPMESRLYTWHDEWYRQVDLKDFKFHNTSDAA